MAANIDTGKLWNKDFSLVVIGQIISLFGNTILRFTLSLYILDVTGSATIFGGITAFSLIPTIILSPFGGIIADRVNRRNIMAVLDFITAFIIFGFSFVLSDESIIPMITGVLVLLSIIQSFYIPSVQASIPTLQSKENLVSANAVVNQVTMLANMIGPILGGLLYGLIGIKLIILISGVSFLLSAILDIFIKMPFEKQAIEHGIIKTVKVDFANSLKFIVKEQPSILRTMLFISLFNFFVASILSVGLPYIIKITLALSSELFGIMAGCMAGAGLLGGIVAGLMSKKLKTQKIYILLITIGASIAPIGFGFLINMKPMALYAVIMVCAMLIQLTASIFSIFALSAIQKKIPNYLLGKVMSFVITLSMCAQPLGQLTYGILIDRFSSYMYIVLLSTAIAVSVTGYCTKKTFYRLDC